MPSRSSRYEVGLLLSLVVLLVLSGIHPHDRFTWVLEVFPVLIGAPILVWLYPRFRFTRLVYSLLWLHAVILMVGGHYTHVAQGFIPALLAREVFIRASPLGGSRWLPFVVVCFCLAFSAFYELIEFWTALASGAAATDFLGTQGDPWDTQWDMQLALIGAIVSLLTLSRLHDRQLAALGVRRSA
jgi:putative membrane protein